MYLSNKSSICANQHVAAIMNLHFVTFG